MSDKQTPDNTPLLREPVATYSVTTKREPPAEDAALAELRERNRRAIALIDRWLNCTEEEAREQRETFEILRKALGEDRASYRKLF
jgi:hypothetical protein